jgi:hypothetical protein
MSDPILDAHREDDHHYILSGPAPISIRDQILRGVMLVERLRETGEIDGNRKLLVVGAGAGGASAAIQAAALQIPTVLVERNNTGFTTQRLAATRVIDPTQYDWPLDHCFRARFPWAANHRPLPLTFPAGRADHLAIRWQYELGVAARAFTAQLLDVRFNTTMSSVTPTLSGLLQITLDPTYRVDVGAIINAKGFGNERCGIEIPPGTLRYEGQPFWGPDRFATIDPNKHKVLISGSGDGALQDYLRIVSGYGRAIDIVRRCNIPDDVLRIIQSAEDRAHRGRSWATNEPPQSRRRHEGPYFWELEIIHRVLVGQLLANPIVRLGLQSLRLKDVPVTIIYPEPFISSYYGLNRFLVLLLAGYLRNTTLHPGWIIDSIAESPPLSHQCIEQKGTQLHAKGIYVSGVLVSHECFEKYHKVTFRRSFPWLSVGPSNPDYNVVIVRHGLQARPTLLQRPRHLLPYHHP